MDLLGAIGACARRRVPGHWVDLGPSKQILPGAWISRLLVVRSGVVVSGNSLTGAARAT